MKRKIAGLLMAALLCIGSAVYLAEPAAAAKSSADFEDLKDLDAATKAKFDALIEAGVFDGVEEGKFGLNDKMNRAQFAKVAALIFDLDVDTSSKASSFSDVKADDPANGYALPYIEAAKAAGITDGYGEGTFNPAGEVTKEQLATFLVRGLGWEKEAQSTPGVSDRSVSDWAQGYVALALEKKIMTGNNDGTFGGTQSAVRSELVDASYGTAQTIVEEYNNYLDRQSDPDNQDGDDVVPPRQPNPKLIESVTKAQEEIERITEEAEKAKEQEKKEQQEATAPSPPSTPYVPYVPPVQSTVATPAAQPASGAVASGTQVVLTSATDSAAIYYTTDLSQPTASSTRYTGPITITSDTTIKAIAVKAGSTNSSVATFEYTVALPIVLPDVILPMTEGQAYSSSIAKLSGGTGDVTYAVTNGALPAGLTLDTNTGAITGTPSVNGNYSFTITATDSATPPITADGQYTGTITAATTKAPLDLINEAAASGEWVGIDETTFANAGITDVTTENIAGIQGILQDYDYPNAALPKTIAEIQTIVNETINLTLINNYFGYGYGTEPDVTTFESAGLTGVTDLNLSDIITHLHSAYGGAGGGPGGFPGGDPGGEPGGGPGGPGGMPGGGSLFPGSTKQEVQAVIDEYLESLT